MNVYRTGPPTVRLSMRAMTVNDADAFLALCGNPQVMRYTHEPLTESLDQARESLRCYPDFDDVGFGRWGCYLNETGQMIGFCGLKRLPDLAEVDVGFRSRPQSVAVRHRAR